MINFDFETYSNNLVKPEAIDKYEDKLSNVAEILNNETLMTGWYNVDKLFEKQLINDIVDTASYIRSNCDVFLVVGIGGSYLGPLAVVEALKPYFYNQKETPQIYFVGTSLSTDYYNDLVNLTKDKDIIVNVISKSGKTLETDITYDLVMKLMQKKYNVEQLKKRVIVTTDKEKGRLREDASNMGYKSFVIPNNIGGRYSVFTPVGLLSIAVAGLNIQELYRGAKLALEDISMPKKYAIAREIMYNQGKVVEGFTVYEPKLYSLTEWLKQLYGESLGKEGKGILPVSFINTRDLHSLGQFIQDGNKIIFETVINVKPDSQVYIDKYAKTLGEINSIASIATSKAHLKGEVPNIIFNLESLNEKTMGYLLQFFMTSCAISGILSEVNPFNQDGVEEYKNIMRSLLENKQDQ